MKDRRKTPPHISSGRRAEALARQWLEARGLAFQQANYRCAAGEIDLVMRDGSVLVFVEVRFRASRRFGEPAETVDRRKRHRLKLAASHYLQQAAAHHAGGCRFDILAICGSGAMPDVHWIRNAIE